MLDQSMASVNMGRDVIKFTLLIYVRTAKVAKKDIVISDTLSDVTSLTNIIDVNLETIVHTFMKKQGSKITRRGKKA